MASLLTHIKVQRSNLRKVALYSAEGTVLCLIGAWFFGKMSIAGMLAVSAAFGICVFIIGGVGVLLTSYTTMREIDSEAAKGKH